MTTRTHEEIQEMLGVYALHALDPEERDLVDEHLEDCPRCQQEVRGHREVATLLGNTGGVAPEGLWERIASRLEELPPPMRLSLSDGQGNVIPLAARRRERTNRFVAAAMGAAAVILIGLLGAQVVRQGSRIEDLESAMSGSSVAAGVATLSSPDGSISADAVLLSDGSGLLLAEDLPGLTAEETYQLWGVTDTGVISLGLLGAEPGRVMPFLAGDDVSGLAVTREVAGGVAQSENPAVVAGEFG